MPTNPNFQNKSKHLIRFGARVLLALFLFVAVPLALFAATPLGDSLVDTYGIEFDDGALNPVYFFDYLTPDAEGVSGLRFDTSGTSGGFVPSGDPVFFGIGKNPTASLDVLGTIAGDFLKLFRPSGISTGDRF